MSDAPSGSADFQALLRLQERDSAIDQLVHRRSHLAAHAGIEDVQKRAGVLRPRLSEATEKRDAAAGRQATLEAEVDSIERRIAEINSRLYGTTTVGPKDAQAMSEEVAHLNERRSKLEDEELEIMEELETLQTEVDRWESQAHELSAELHRLQTEANDEQSDIDAQLETERQQREAAASAVPGSLLKEYDRLRGSLGRVAVAPLVGGSCGGCHLTIAASELARIRKAPEDAVVHCEECGRILVR